MDNSLKIFVKLGKCGTKSLCSTHLQDVTSKIIPKITHKPNEVQNSNFKQDLT